MADIKNEGRIEQLKGRIRSKWGDITDNDIDRARGDVERLIGTIKEKTGESVETIRSRLDEMMGEESDHIKEQHTGDEHGQPGGTHHAL